MKLSIVNVNLSHNSPHAKCIKTSLAALAISGYGLPGFISGTVAITVLLFEARS